MASGGLRRGFVLASQSPARAKILKNAGLDFTVEPADIDETSFKSEAQEPAHMAACLAREKASVVSKLKPGQLILAADQVLDFEGEILSKAADLGELKSQLKKLRGNKHALITALVFMEDGEIRFEHFDTATLHMRDYSNSFLDYYLKLAGPQILECVGGYQLEKSGAQLFSRIEGDYFTILGLPLLPVLQYLRSTGQIGV